MSQQNDFPEVSDFLQKMKFRKSVFGYDKEDVMVKMQQLNSLYQERFLVLQGQMEQERKILREEMESQKEKMAEQIREEEREKILVSVGEKRLEHQKELRMLGEELKRLTEQLANLRGHVEQMSKTADNV